MSGAEALLARYLRQRQEIGELELVLDPAGLAAVRALQAAGAAGPERAAVTGARASAASNPPATPPAGFSRPVTTVERPFARNAAIAVPPLVPRPLPPDSPLVTLGAAAAACTACGLAATRTTVVFGEGDPQARLVVVGEAPGADEDRSGRPFVGRAGKLLNTLLLSIGFPRESVYICNVLKCRPPGNRNPLPHEVEACSSFLRGQLHAIRPRAILAVGTFPAQTLLQTAETIGRLRGTVHSYEGVPLVPTYHPAALLRNPGWIRPVWEDLQRLRRLLDD